LAETNRWVALANKAVEVACRDTNQLSALLRPALLNRFTLLQHLSRPAATLSPASKPVPADIPPANAPVTCSNECQRVLEVIRRVLGTEHLETPRAMRDLAVACRTQGDVAQARELAESALSGLRRVFGQDHPETLKAMQELVAIYQEHGQTAQAQELTAEVAQVLRRVFGSDHPLVREKLEASYFEQGRLAEIKELNRGMLPAQRSPTWRKAWEPIGAALQQGTAACRSNHWQEAARVLDQALKSPAYDWEAAKVEIPYPQLWMGVAFVRASLAERHAQLCRELAAEVETSTDSAASARRAAKVCLLPAAPSPELLLQASNLLQFAESRTTGADLVAWQQLNWALLHFRTGQHAEALESCHKAALSTNIFCRETALLLHSMAAKRLGRDREAEELWRAAKAQLPQLTKKGWDPNRLLFDVPNLLIFELLLDEAELLITKQSGPPPPAESTPPAGLPASRNSTGN
jgi:tetratricopeptide (TPR) repeat protein